MRTLSIATAAFAAAVAVFVALTLPARGARLTPASDGTVAGVLHVHTNRSDGLGSTDDVAAAAARAGLQFVVITDHGDGSRPPDPPAYRSGVLCLDAVEISTNQGHYLALGLPAAPYPLGGDARAVVEDVRRLGGFGIVAHPDSPKSELRWRAWDVPFDGVEWLNLDTGWRALALQPGVGSKWRLFQALTGYPFRSSEVIAALIQPSRSVDAWRDAARARRVVTVAGADAHARVGLRGAEDGGRAWALPFPSYESVFRVASVRVRLDHPLTGQADKDAAAILRSLRAGHLYTAVDAVAAPPSFSFTATNAFGTVGEGDQLTVGGRVRLRIRSNAPPGFTTIVYQDDTVLASAPAAPDVSVEGSDEPSMYWVEIVQAGRTPPVTWIRSNAIAIRAADAATRRPGLPPAGTFRSLLEQPARAGWHTEAHATSGARLGGEGPVIRLEYRLSGSPGEVGTGQYAAMSHGVAEGGVAAFDRIALGARSERAMRVAVQLRTVDDQRWSHSVYLDGVDREVEVPFDEFQPVAPAHTPHPPLDRVRDVMIVVDTVNTRPGTSGRLWVHRLDLAR